MLQVSDVSQSTRRALVNPRAVGAKSLPAKSRIDELITAFMSARRTARIARTEYDELAAKHPDLCVDDPIIFLFTNGDGEPVHGDFRDIRRFFPEAHDGWSPGTKKRRELLQQQYGEARRRLADQRKAAGLTASWDRMAAASDRERQGLLALCRHRPTSTQEMRTQVRVVRKYLPEIAHAIGGAVNGKRFKIYGARYDSHDYVGWCEARGHAFDYLATLVLALGKVGGR